MSTITTELAGLLNKVQRPGDFYATGTTELFAPSLEVEGVGLIALPLLPIQAEQLVAVAEQAPYGRGEETLIDTTVRRTWQIDAAKIRIGGRNWPRTLDTIVERSAEGLGVTKPVVAELYKLLVYDQGSFFVSHRDTEKAPGMFATLIIVLPSLYTGGELRVCHRDREVQLDMRCSEPSEVAFAAFYADCVHEILPVASGCRLTLVYNLLLRPGKGKSRLPEPPNYETEQTALVDLLQQWIADKESPDDDSPEKLVYPLQHAYTPAALAFDALKGADAAAASVLVPAAEQADCDLHLTLASIEESGGAEYTGDYYGSRRRRRWSGEDEDEDEDEDEFEIVDIGDRIATLTEWRRPDGGQSDLGTLPFEEDELCPPGAFDNLKPDEQHFHEASGNEGASFERTYRRAGLVLWPRGRRLAVLNQAGLPATLPYLGELAQRWVESDDGPESALWRQAHELAGHMLRTWPREGRHWRTDTQSSEAKMLALLNRLRDAARIDAFLADLSATGEYSLGDNAALVEALGLLPPARATELIERIVAGNAGAALGACGDLLARCAAVARDTGRAVDFRPAARALVEALPGDPARAPQPDWRRPRVEPSFIVDLLTALGQLDAGLADRAADHIPAWPQTYGLDAVLVPAVLMLTERTATRDGAAVRRLRAACLTHLRARIAEPLEPPRDWTRASVLPCRCRHCGELSQFLADPNRKMWTFKAAAPDREHVEDSIKRAGSDVDRMTDRHGRPYTLICTKNQASYERRAQQRKKDLAEAARLEGAPT
ncbi:MAG: 2OG-Fe(II) oxygenase [Candidatus Competibacter sp.]|nr:2OG-Fe(II) oxygenase [Candidatus Competibacter sp.]